MSFGLLNTIGIVIREREIVAEPFLLIGLMAVVRRILLVTAEAENTEGRGVHVPRSD
jgi:Phosphate-starvation-inducible E family